MLNIGINEEEVIDLWEVVDFLESQENNAPYLKFEIDLQNAADIATFNDESGKLTIMADESYLGQW